MYVGAYVYANAIFVYAKQEIIVLVCTEIVRLTQRVPGPSCRLLVPRRYLGGAIVEIAAGSTAPR